LSTCAALTTCMLAPGDISHMFSHLGLIYGLFQARSIRHSSFQDSCQLAKPILCLQTRMFILRYLSIAYSYLVCLLCWKQMPELASNSTLNAPVPNGSLKLSNVARGSYPAGWPMTTNRVLLAFPGPTLRLGAFVLVGG
jgi:hypothetical protein